MPNDNKKIEDMSPDEAAASLAFATHLNDQFMPQPQMMGQEEQSQTPEMAPQEAQPQEPGQEAPQEQTPNLDEITANLDKKLEEVRNEVKDTIKSELSNFKKIIEDALR